VLEKLDRDLCELFEAVGGIDRLLEEFCVIITGDHAQVNIDSEEERAAIQVDKLLSAFRLPGPGQVWTDGEELLVCPNMRAVQIYFRRPDAAILELVASRLLEDPRVDQVIWRAVHANLHETGYHVMTRDRGRLHAWPVAPGASPPDGVDQASDPWGTTWQWCGSLAALDAHVEDGRLCYGDYPNALERIAGALEAETAGELWATARPGFEFSLAKTAVHTGGGSHGSLHTGDSTVPLLVAGLPDDVSLPPFTRTVDVTPLALAVLGVRSGPALGAGRVLQPD
jgi:hypothetical protein